MILSSFLCKFLVDRYEHTYQYKKATNNDKGEIMGHRTTKMTKRYSHLVPDTLKKAVDDVFEGW